MGKTGPRFDFKPKPATLELTPRQIEVLQLVADGMQSLEIAHKLSLGVRTVEVHRRDIRLRLATRSGSIGHAVAVAMRSRWPCGRG